MRSIWDAGVRADLIDRAARLRPEARARWGRFTCPQMVVHVTDAGRMALGELPVAPKGGPLRYPALKQLIVYALPFPKSAPTAPELLARPPGEWTGELEAFREVMERLGRRPAADALPEHPAFGKLSRRAWGVLIQRHTDHHFRQFGV